MRLNEMLLRRKQKVFIQDVEMLENKTDNSRYVATINKNIENLGYTFDSDLFEVLSTYYDIDELKDFYLQLVNKLKQYVGANKEYNPMYVNFPQEVMDTEESELYINAILHYWSNGALYPNSEKDERLPLFEETKINVLSIGNEEELMDIFTNLVNSKTSLSQQDKEDIEWFFDNTEFMNYLPEEITYKENVALIVKLMLKHKCIKDENDIDVISKYFKTATDVLRLVTCMSDGDICLKENTRFRNFKRSERRMIMQLLSNCGNIEEDMLKYKERWKRIGEKIHPSEFKNVKFAKVNVAFRKLRNDEYIKTFNNTLKSCLDANDLVKVLTMLSNRGGEFARKLDYLLRTYESVSDRNLIIDSFKNVADTISTPVLLQVMKHFETRNTSDVRVFIPKGNVTKTFCKKNDEEYIGIPSNYVNKVAHICRETLTKLYSDKESLGKVYIDDDMKNYIIPFSQRSASKSYKTLTRGSRIKLNDNTKTVRAFIWWTNNCEKIEDGWEDRIDIDLSACILDKNFKYKEHVSYTNLKSTKYQAFHSGDIVDGGDVNGQGVSEFIDCDIESVLKFGGRYIVYQVYSYSQIDFSNMVNCNFGFMQREDVNSGEIYEPKTVLQNMHLSSQSTVSLPVIFDCLTREFIWCDVNIGCESLKYKTYTNNVENNFTSVTSTCYAIVNMNKPTMYEVAQLNALGRGELVGSREEADVIISNDTTKPTETLIHEIKNEKGEIISSEKEIIEKDVKFITMYDTDIWVSDMI